MHPVVSNKVFLIKSSPDAKQSHIGITPKAANSGMFYLLSDIIETLLSIWILIF